jgi:hypothetical protein
VQEEEAEIIQLQSFLLETMVPSGYSLHEEDGPRVGVCEVMSGVVGGEG